MCAIRLFLLLLGIMILASVQYPFAQSKSSDAMTPSSNPILCDIQSGVCSTDSQHAPITQPIQADYAQRKIKVIYYTDPICSSCWGIEPQLRKLKLEYGQYIDIEYRMGGLLPDWSYNSGGISKPSDVAHHWDEVSVHYDMPIDGDVWLSDPLDSSYPPSIAFKAAQIQDKAKAIIFLRAMRELLFLERRNITKWEYLSTAAQSAELDVEKLKDDYENGAAFHAFQEDLQLGKSLGVRGFPTMYFINDEGNKELVYGSKPYAYYEMAILKINPDAKKQDYPKDWRSLFSIYPTMTVREYSELSGTPRVETEHILDELVTQGHLSRLVTKNGSLYRRKV